MVKQISWSPLAKEALKSLLMHSLQKHGDKSRGKMMYSLLQGALHRITLNPFIGQATEMDNIRYITPHPDYTLFYRHSLLKIESRKDKDRYRRKRKARKKLPLNR